MKCSLILVFLAVGYCIVSGEPPLPLSQYLPSNQFGPSRQSFDTPYGEQNRNYGAPSQTTALIRPNSQYRRIADSYRPSVSGRYPTGGGTGGSYDDQFEAANYNFKYDVQAPEFGNDFGHEESRQGDVAQGRYYVLLPDGRRQVVEYVADEEGYKPRVSFDQVADGYNRAYQGDGQQESRGNNAGYPY